MDSVDGNEMVKTKYFLPQARLTRGQRKYCHCLMKVRPTLKNNAYGICRHRINTTLKRGGKGKSGKSYVVNYGRTNCVMNYQYNDYSLAEIQAFCLEKNIPIAYSVRNGPNTGKQHPYKKATLIAMLIQHYLARRLEKRQDNK